MKRSRVLPVLFALAVIGGALWWWQARKADGGGELLTLYGNVEIHQVQLGFRVGGRLEAVLIEEGQRVKKGDPLARLDAGPYADELEQARAQLTMQESELRKMQVGYRVEDVEQARAAKKGSEAALTNTTANLRRIESLAVRKAVSRKDLDEARAAYTESLSRFRADSEQLRLMQSGYREEDIAKQAAAVHGAAAALSVAHTRLNDTALVASKDGVVLTRVREAGAVVQPGQTVYCLTLDHPVWIRAFVTQPQLGLVRPGQGVLLEVDAMPGKQYTGTVGFISTTAEFTPKTVETHEVRNDLVFAFRVIAEDPDNVMRQGMPITVRLRKNGEPFDQAKDKASPQVKDGDSLREPS